MNDTAPVLELRHVSKSFSGVEVLHDVSFDLQPGEVHCLVGENGAGKSTLIKIISGAYRQTRGRSRISAMASTTWTRAGPWVTGSARSTRRSMSCPR